MTLWFMLVRLHIYRVLVTIILLHFTIYNGFGYSCLRELILQRIFRFLDQIRNECKIGGGMQTGPIKYSCGFDTAQYVSQHGGAIDSVIYDYISLDRCFSFVRTEPNSSNLYLHTHSPNLPFL